MEEEHAKEETGFKPPVFEWNPNASSGVSYLGILPFAQFGSYDQHAAPGKIKTSTAHRRSRQRQSSGISQVLAHERDDKKLQIAVEKGDDVAARSLLEGGADPSAGDAKGRTALHIAAAKGESRLVSLLLSHGADPNKKDSIGNTPLHLAACTNHIQIVTLLLKAGTDVNALDNTGRSPLHLATGRLRMLKSGRHFSNDHLKQEVTHIIEMMREYLSRSETDTAQLDQFQSRLNETENRDVIDEVNDLLANFAGLQLTKHDTEVT